MQPLVGIGLIRENQEFYRLILYLKISFKKMEHEVVLSQIRQKLRADKS